MNRSWIHHLLLGGALVILGTQARASVIWSQAPTGEDNNNITGFVNANDFELSQPTTLTDFTVWLSDRAQSSVLDGVADNFSGTLAGRCSATAAAYRGRCS